MGDIADCWSVYICNSDVYRGYGGVLNALIDESLTPFAVGVVAMAVLASVSHIARWRSRARC